MKFMITFSGNFKTSVEELCIRDVYIAIGEALSTKFDAEDLDLDVHAKVEL